MLWWVLQYNNKGVSHIHSPFTAVCEWCYRWIHVVHWVSTRPLWRISPVACCVLGLRSHCPLLSLIFGLHGGMIGPPAVPVCFGAVLWRFGGSGGGPGSPLAPWFGGWPLRPAGRSLAPLRLRVSRTAGGAAFAHSGNSELTLRLFGRFGSLLGFPRCIDWFRLDDFSSWHFYLIGMFLYPVSKVGRDPSSSSSFSSSSCV